MKVLSRIFTLLRISSLMMLTLSCLAHAESLTVKEISCGGNNPGTLGASLMIKLIKESDESYKVTLSRESKDQRINIKDKEIVKGILCEFGKTDGPNPAVVAQCMGAHRKSPSRFRLEYFTKTAILDSYSARQSSWHEVTVQSVDLIPLNEAGLDINSVFGSKNAGNAIVSAVLSSPYKCVAVE